jgi:hypothetical protein
MTNYRPEAHAMGLKINIRATSSVDSPMNEKIKKENSLLIVISVRRSGFIRRERRG